MCYAFLLSIFFNCVGMDVKFQMYGALGVSCQKGDSLFV